MIRNQLLCLNFKAWTKQYIWKGNLPLKENGKYQNIIVNKFKIVNKYQDLLITDQYFVVISDENIVYIYSHCGLQICNWCFEGIYLKSAVYGKDILGIVYQMYDKLLIIIYKIGFEFCVISKSYLKLMKNDSIRGFMYNDMKFYKLIVLQKKEYQH